MSSEKRNIEEFDDTKAIGFNIQVQLVPAKEQHVCAGCGNEHPNGYMYDYSMRDLEGKPLDSDDALKKYGHYAVAVMGLCYNFAAAMPLLPHGLVHTVAEQAAQQDDMVTGGTH